MACLRPDIHFETAETAWPTVYYSRPDVRRKPPRSRPSPRDLVSSLFVVLVGCSCLAGGMQASRHGRDARLDDMVHALMGPRTRRCKRLLEKSVTPWNITTMWAVPFASFG